MTLIGGIAGFLCSFILIGATIATVILFGMFFWEVPLLALGLAVILALRVLRTRRLRDSSVWQPLTFAELQEREMAYQQAVSEATIRQEAAKPTSLD